MACGGLACTAGLGFASTACIVALALRVVFGAGGPGRQSCRPELSKALVVAPRLAAVRAVEKLALHVSQAARCGTVDD